MLYGMICFSDDNVNGIDVVDYKKVKAFDFWMIVMCFDYWAKTDSIWFINSRKKENPKSSL